MVIHKNYLPKDEAARFQRKLGALEFLQRTALLAVLSPVALLSTIPAAVGQERRGEEDRRIDEITVTATKRETSLYKTPEAVSVVSEDTIEKRNLVGMEDYLAGLPGVSYQDRGAAANSITIRGIGMGQQLEPNSSVGSYFGEVPITGLGTRLNANWSGNADIKMVDIERVEVLRGPQGTLYGSGTMGGTVRVIPNAPNLQEVEGTVAARYSHTGERGGNNYMAQAVINAPLIEDQLAVRAVAYRFDNAGYVDNVAVSNPTPETVAAVDAGAVAEDRENFGGDVYNGVRVTGLWQPTSKFSLTLMHMHQEIAQDGFKEINTNLPGDFLTSVVKTGPTGLRDGYVNVGLGITNLVLEYDLKWGSLLNSTSYVDSEGISDFPLSFLGTEFGGVFLGTADFRDREEEILVNETRFTSELAGPFQFLAGLYYEDRTSDVEGSIRWVGVPPAPTGAFTNQNKNRDTLEQITGFGEVSFNPVEPLTVTVGARYYKFNQAIPISRSFGVPGATEGTSASVDGVNFKTNLSYALSDQFFAYALWSQGFRAPKVQGQILPEYDIDNDGLVEFRDGIDRDPPEGLLDPDTVDNYEVGIKYQSSEGRLAGSLTAFRVDWSGIPIVPSLVEFTGAALFFNAGEAQSEGIEFQASGEVIDDLIVELSASWIDSVLAESAPGLGVAGADLPGSADYNASVAVEKRFVIGGRDAYLRGDYTYVGEYFSDFSVTGRPAGDYHVIDLNSGVAIGNINVGLFANNITNADDFTWQDNIFFGRAYRLRPRTVGVEFSASF